MGITVKEALSIGRLKEGKVVAGEKGLNRIVSYVDILEVPDVLNWLRGEELILTTGYAIKDRPDIQEKLVLELARINAAGIVIKLNRFLDNIPEKMIEKANEVNLPIIQIPPDIPYIEITHPLLKEILLRQNREKFINETLKEILYCYNGDEDFVKRKLQLLSNNFDVNAPMVVAVASYDNIQNLKKLIKVEDLQHTSKVISGEINDVFVFIFNINISSEAEWKEDIEKLLFYPDSFEGISNSKIICVISRIINNPMTIQKEYERLNNAIKTIGKLPIKKKSWYFYDEIVHYIFLHGISNSGIVKDFVDYIMEPFKNLPEKDREVMISTLYDYVRNGGNISKTSKNCFLHRNTLIYRINKLNKILNNSINNSEEMFKYYLALTLYRLIESKYS